MGGDRGWRVEEGGLMSRGCNFFCGGREFLFIFALRLLLI